MSEVLKGVSEVRKVHEGREEHEGHEGHEGRVKKRGGAWVSPNKVHGCMR